MVFSVCSIATEENYLLLLGKNVFNHGLCQHRIFCQMALHQQAALDNFL